MDQITNKGRRPISRPAVSCAPRSCISSTTRRAAGPKHDQAIHAVLAHLPGMKPSNSRDARASVKSAVRDDDSVAVCIVHGLKALQCDVPADEDLVQHGRANVVRRGRDVSVFTSGEMVHPALTAAEVMDARRVSVERVVDLRSLIPLDWNTMERPARPTRRVVVCDHGHFTGGFEPTIAAGVQGRAFGALRAPVVSVASLDIPIGHNLQLADHVVQTVDRLLVAVSRVRSAS